MQYKLGLVEICWYLREVKHESYADTRYIDFGAVYLLYPKYRPPMFLKYIYPSACIVLIILYGSSEKVRFRAQIVIDCHVNKINRDITTNSVE